MRYLVIFISMIIIRERFRCNLFALYYFRMKLCQNVEKRRFIECNLRNIRRNVAKILRIIHVVGWIIEIPGAFGNTVYRTYAIQLLVSLDVIVLI